MKKTGETSESNEALIERLLRPRFSAAEESRVFLKNGASSRRRCDSNVSDVSVVRVR